MDLKECVAYFLSLFPEHLKTYNEHIEFHDELLGHVFFADAINRPLFELLKENENNKLIKKYIDFINTMYHNGDDAVKNIVVVTILEYLGDDKDALKTAHSLFSDEVKKASREIEILIGRI